MDKINPINKLAERLYKLSIPYKVDELLGGLQMTFNWSKADFICHPFSEGYEKGLLEAKGEDVMTSEELEEDSVIGYMTICDAANRISKAYEMAKITEAEPNKEG